MNLKQFNKLWPRIGGLFAIIITITVVLLWNSNSNISHLVLIYWFNLAILMFHEFEEYVYPGGFKEFANSKTVLSLPDPKQGNTISDMLIISINLGIWVFFIIGALLAKIVPWLGFGMIIFNFINILGHLIIFQKKVKGYNPGVITAIIMIPFLIWAIIIIGDMNQFSSLDYVLSIIVGLISGISLPIIGIIRRKKILRDLSQTGV